MKHRLTALLLVLLCLPLTACQKQQNLYSATSVSYTHLTLPTTPYV